MQQGQQYRHPQDVNAQQTAILQQMAQARGQQGQNSQWTPQQLQMAMSAMQSQGANANTQALLQAALKANSRPGMPMDGQGHNGSLQMGRPGQSGHQATEQAQMMQQQRVQQLMQHQVGAVSAQQLQAMQGGMVTPSASSPMRPSQQLPQHTRNVAHPPQPGPHRRSGQTNNGTPQSAQPQPLSLSAQQQQLFAAQRSNLVASPQFQRLLPQQQHQQLGMMTQHMMRAFAQQNVQTQQQYQQQQYQQSMPQTTQSAIGQQYVQAQAQPLSSLPQHMAPPNSASAALQRVPSPHPGSAAVARSTNTPPPIQQKYPSAPPYSQNPPSPSPSNHSHHSQQHQTPRQQPIQPPMLSSPSPAHPSTPVYQMGQHLTGSLNVQQQSNSQVALAMQAMQQHAQNAQTMLQSGQLTGQPQLGSQKTTSQQPPQQMTSAMEYIDTAKHSEAGTQNIRPGMVSRPPVPNINMSDFPFDWRLLPQISHLNDPKWRSEVQQRNPRFLAAVQSAAAIVTSGSIRQDVLQRMQQVILHAARSQSTVVRPPQQPGPPTTQHQQQLASLEMSAYPQDAQLTQQHSQGLSSAQQQRLLTALQVQGSPGQTLMYGNARPPPPHLPPSRLVDSPSADTIPIPTRRVSASKEQQIRDITANQMSMPPPAWIPSHGLARPPPHTAPEIPFGHGGQSPHAVPFKAWESALRLDLPITNISPLPTNEMDESVDHTFGGRLMGLSEQEREQVHGWLRKDKTYAEDVEKHKINSQSRMIKWAAKNDMDTPWWQVRKGERYRHPEGRLSILWPQDKANMRARSSHKGRKEIRL